MTVANRPPTFHESVSSGLRGVDDLIGGLIPGDNVVWASDDTALFDLVEAGLLHEAAVRGFHCIYVTNGRSPSAVVGAISPDVPVFDARARGRYGDPAVLEQALVGAAAEHVPLCVIFDGLDGFARRMGDAKAAAFFSRVCPRLFDLDAIAYWRAPRPAVSRSVMDRVTGVTQCVLELTRGRMRVVKAEGRAAAVQGRVVRAHIADADLVIEAERAVGRLARGLERIREERQLSQTDLARLADVSPSAISQAEAGRRGLSLDTLLLLAERLGATIDDLLAPPPPAGYVLARRERSGRHAPLTPLLDDPKAGLRAFLIRLPPGGRGQPPHLHKGAELVVVAAGLVQLEIGPDTPVLRGGDAALITSVPLSSWRNLTGEPAVLFWILRDD